MIIQKYITSCRNGVTTVFPIQHDGEAVLHIMNNPDIKNLRLADRDYTVFDLSVWELKVMNEHYAEKTTVGMTIIPLRNIELYLFPRLEITASENTEVVILVTSPGLERRGLTL